MKIFKVFKTVTRIGEKITDFFASAVDFADHLIHRKEYERRAKRRRMFWTILLSILGGLVAVLLFPYRVIVKRNGDFEIRSLLIRVYRRTEDYAIPEGGSDEFEIADAAMDENVDEIEL